jgi:hypothetical protein
MIGTLPLWVIVASWWLQKRSKGIWKFDYLVHRKFINSLLIRLPIGRNRFERWLGMRVHRALIRELEALDKLQEAGLVLTGIKK